MSYVDLSWPWGLFILGLCPLLSPSPAMVFTTRTVLVMAAYSLAGLRMGLGGVAMALRGHLNQAGCSTLIGRGLTRLCSDWLVFLTSALL